MEKKKQQEQDIFLMEFCHTLTRVARAYKTSADRLSSQYGLSRATAWPAVLISRMGDDVRPGEIANALGIDPSSVVRIIDQLIDADLMTRKEDPNDRRVRLLSMTENGKRRVEVTQEALFPFRRKLFNRIDPDELKICIKVLAELSEAIKKD